MLAFSKAFEHEIKGILPDYGWIFVFGVSDKHAIDCLLWDVWKLAPVYFTSLVMRTHCKDQTLYITGHSFSLATPSHIRISTVFLWIEGCVNFHKTTPIQKMRLDETCPTVSGSHLVWKHHVILVNFNFTLLQLHSTREQLLETTTTRLYHSHSTNYLVGDCHLRMAVQSDKKSSKL